MSILSRVACVALFIVSAGCHHATVETGATPSTVVINKNWASGWIYGLVPPSTVSTAQRCPDGVAKVETQLSFLNQLVSILTLGIYTPMQIVVTCAAGSSASADTGSFHVTALAPSQAAIEQAFAKAISQSMATNKPVYLRF